MIWALHRMRKLRPCSIFFPSSPFLIKNSANKNFVQYYKGLLFFTGFETAIYQHLEIWRKGKASFRNVHTWKTWKKIFSSLFGKFKYSQNLRVFLKISKIGIFAATSRPEFSGVLLAGWFMVSKNSRQVCTMGRLQDSTAGTLQQHWFTGHIPIWCMEIKVQQTANTLSNTTSKRAEQLGKLQHEHLMTSSIK